MLFDGMKYYSINLNRVQRMSKKKYVYFNKNM